MRQRELGRAVVAVLGVLVLVALIRILTGSKLDGTDGRILLTSVAIAFFALLAASGMNLSRRRRELSPLGDATTLASAAGLVLVVIEIWSEHALPGDWRAATYALLISLTLGQAAVLLALAQPDDGDGIGLLRAVTIGAAVLLLGLAIAEISSPGRDVDPRWFAALGLIYGFGMLVLLARGLTRRLGAPPAEPPPSGAPPAPTAAAPVAAQLDHVGIPVSDWERSGRFYREVLGVDARPSHAQLSFAWQGDAASAIEHLRRQGVEVLAPPSERQGAHGRGESVYFRDPAGRLVELIAYG